MVYKNEFIGPLFQHQLSREQLQFCLQLQTLEQFSMSLFNIGSTWASDPHEKVLNNRDANFIQLESDKTQI